MNFNIFTLINIFKSEANNLGFEIDRKQDNSEWEKIGFVRGHGTTTEPKEYSYIDDIRTFRSALIVYQLKQIDFDGTFTYSDEIEVEINAPATFSLDQSYPNPFNPNTVIEFSLPEDVSNVKLSVYNTLGERVAELVNTSLSDGMQLILPQECTFMN